MNGALTLLPLYAFMTWTGTILPLPLLSNYKLRIGNESNGRLL